jgi:hypothetical protein
MSLHLALFYPNPYDKYRRVQCLNPITFTKNTDCQLAAMEYHWNWNFGYVQILLVIKYNGGNSVVFQALCLSFFHFLVELLARSLRARICAKANLCGAF